MSLIADLELSTLLRAARSRAGLTQRDLARSAGSTQALVARFESGRANPTLDTLVRLFDAAGVDLVFGVRPKAAIDPVIASYGRDVDRTLLRENLARSPEERVATLEAMARFHAEAGRARMRRNGQS